MDLVHPNERMAEVLDDHRTDDGKGLALSWLNRVLSVRQLDSEITRRIYLLTAGIAASGGVFSILISFVARSAIADYTGEFWFGWALLLDAAVFIVIATGAFGRMEHSTRAIYLSQIASSITAVSVGLYFAGPHWMVAAGVYSVILIFAFYIATIPLAVFVLAFIAAQFAIVLALRTGFDFPIMQWFFLVIVMGGIGGVVGQLTRGVDEMAESERQSRHALAQINADLEFMVDEQVHELSRLGRLRRFLSPQVAEAILESEHTDLTAPHRQIVAVLFADLRGFTHFSANTQPEDVMEVLDAYYQKAGALFAEMGATIGGFTGDGVMAFFNDPVPHNDPSGAAVELAVRLRSDLDLEIGTWSRRGYQLGIGMGVAYGYATLGLIGCEGRYDYTALGPVVNLASRLCNAAPPGEILIDDRTHDAVRGRAEVEELELTLKGLAEPLRVQRVVSWRRLHVAQEMRSA